MQTSIVNLPAGGRLANGIVPKPVRALAAVGWQMVRG
jgi:hypothetical protein